MERPETRLERLIRKTVAGRPAAGILDSPEDVASLRTRLEEATAEVFAKYDQAHRESWKEAYTSFVD